MKALFVYDSKDSPPSKHGNGGNIRIRFKPPIMPMSSGLPVVGPLRNAVSKSTWGHIDRITKPIYDEIGRHTHAIPKP
jgi:hypothetical protein